MSPITSEPAAVLWSLSSSRAAMIPNPSRGQQGSVITIDTSHLFAFPPDSWTRRYRSYSPVLRRNFRWTWLWSSLLLARNGGVVFFPTSFCHDDFVFAPALQFVKIAHPREDFSRFVFLFVSLVAFCQKNVSVAVSRVVFSAVKSLPFLPNSAARPLCSLRCLFKFFGST